MNLGRCPACHAHLALDAVAADDAARELLGLLAPLPGDLGRALVLYLALFRPARQDLRWERALRLARDVLALEADANRLCAALEVTVEAIRAKGGALPLRNHAYLQRVAEQLPAVVDAAPRPRRAAARQAEPSKMLQGIASLIADAGHDPAA